MKKTNKKLLLSRETVRKLSKEELTGRVVGGSGTPYCVPISLVGPIPSLGSSLTGLTTTLMR